MTSRSENFATVASDDENTLLTEFLNLNADASETLKWPVEFNDIDSSPISLAEALQIDDDLIGECAANALQFLKTDYEAELSLHAKTLNERGSATPSSTKIMPINHAAPSNKDTFVCDANEKLQIAIDVYNSSLAAQHELNTKLQRLKEAIDNARDVGNISAIEMFTHTPMAPLGEWLQIQEPTLQPDVSSKARKQRARVNQSRRPDPLSSPKSPKGRSTAKSRPKSKLRKFVTPVYSLDMIQEADLATFQKPACNPISTGNPTRKIQAGNLDNAGYTTDFSVSEFTPQKDISWNSSNLSTGPDVLRSLM